MTSNNYVCNLSVNGNLSSANLLSNRSFAFVNLTTLVQYDFVNNFTMKSIAIADSSTKHLLLRYWECNCSYERSSCFTLL